MTLGSLRFYKCVGADGKTVFIGDSVPKPLEFFHFVLGDSKTRPPCQSICVEIKKNGGQK